MEIGISILSGKRCGDGLPDFLSMGALAQALRFHRSMPMYRKTPLVALPSLSQRLGVRGIFVKDESRRFGLNAFKALGAAYAIAKLLSEKLGHDDCLSYRELMERKEQFGDLVFVTATDGNHGKGVAWAASVFGYRAILYMPKGSQPCRADAIREINGTPVTVTELNYDDTVRFACTYAQENGFYLMQDTGFPGYEEIPNAITQGYATMAAEAVEQLAGYGISKPTHVFLQAGVGSMAGGVLGYLTGYYDKKPPIAVIVEPSAAACIYESVRQGDGMPHSIGGNPQTIMAGLNCGEPNPFTWPVLRDHALFYASCPDWVAAGGMRALAKPTGDDTKVISGESGAVGLGLLSSLCQRKAYAEYKQMLGLGRDSIVLLFSTEGDTDPETYQKNIEEGHDET